MKLSFTRFALTLLLSVSSAHAEFLQIDLSIFGMD